MVQIDIHTRTVYRDGRPPPSVSKSTHACTYTHLPACLPACLPARAHCAKSEPCYALPPALSSTTSALPTGARTRRRTYRPTDVCLPAELLMRGVGGDGCLWRVCGALYFAGLAAFLKPVCLTGRLLTYLTRCCWPARESDRPPLLDESGDQTPTIAIAAISRVRSRNPSIRCSAGAPDANPTNGDSQEHVLTSSEVYRRSRLFRRSTPRPGGRRQCRREYYLLVDATNTFRLFRASVAGIICCAVDTHSRRVRTISQREPAPQVETCQATMQLARPTATRTPTPPTTQPPPRPQCKARPPPKHQHPPRQQPPQPTTQQHHHHTPVATTTRRPPISISTKGRGNFGLGHRPPTARARGERRREGARAGR